MMLFKFIFNSIQPNGEILILQIKRPLFYESSVLAKFGGNIPYLTHKLNFLDNHLPRKDRDLAAVAPGSYDMSLTDKKKEPSFR